MTDKVQLIKEEIERLKNEQLSIFSKGENVEICGTALISIGVYNQLLSFINSLPEEHNEDLEEAAQEYSFNIPTQLEADIIWKRETEQHFKDGAEWHNNQMKETLQTEYEKGRYDMREEMMKDAVIAWVNTYESVTNPYDNEVSFITNLSPSKFKNKETVKIIIVKEE